MSSSSKSGTTRNVSPFAAMPPAKVTWPPAVTAPDVPRALSTSTASSGSRAIASRRRVDGGAERQAVEQVVVLLEVELADGPADGDLVDPVGSGERAVPEPPHQAALTDPRHAADDHEGDGALPRGDELVERVAVVSVEHDEVGQLAGLDRADEVIPLERLGRVDR